MQSKSSRAPSDTATSLADAPDEIKLAVDLIYLLETNRIPVETALSALDIVKADLVKKLPQDNV